MYLLTRSDLGELRYMWIHLLSMLVGVGHFDTQSESFRVSLVNGYIHHCRARTLPFELCFVSEMSGTIYEKIAARLHCYLRIRKGTNGLSALSMDSNILTGRASLGI